MTDYEKNKAWLDSLKEGDQVACKTRHLDGIGHNYGYKVLVIRKITPKRTRFDAVGPDSESYTFDKRGANCIGTKWSRHTFRLEPLTPRVYEDIQRDTMSIRAGNRRHAIAKKLEELRYAFGTMGPDFQLEFLGASEQLLQLLDKHTAPDPEDS